jgi:hypothetical protein
MNIRRAVPVLCAIVLALGALVWVVAGPWVTPAVADDPSEEGLQEFVPTEKVPADDAVAFPVDI